MRTPSRFAAYALLILSSITCTDGPTAPRSAGGPTVLSIVPSFSVAGQQTMRDLGAFGLTVDNIHIHIDHPPALPYDTVVTVPVGTDVVTLNLSVLLNAPTEQLNVHIELRQGTTVLYSGTQTVTASVGATTTAPPATIPIVYVGPGADLRNFSIAPHDTAILISGTVPFRVTATDAAGAAAIGVEIHWTVANAALGAVDAASGVFTPAGNSGTTFVIAATPNGLRDSATVIVSALPAKLVLVNGGSQTGAAGSALAQAVVVQVQAANGSPVAGAVVAFGGGTGGAAANPATATTGADGDAQTVVTLGHGSGAQTIVASVAGVSDLTITATATAAAAASIAKVAGDAQDDTLGAVLKPLVVAVTDGFGNAVAGATVTWARIAGSGTLAAASTTTDATGKASVGYTLGHTAGTDTVRATLSGVSGAAVNFTATGHLRATKIAIASGDGQSALPGAVLALPLTVLVADSTGKPVAGATVTWTAISPGTLNPATSVSDSVGHASTTMTLGSSGGAYFVSASLAGGLLVQFTENAVPPTTDSLHFVTQPSNVVAATYITPSIQVELLDAAGHRDTAGVGASASVALSVLHGPAGGRVRDSVGFAADTVHAVKGLATFRVGNDIAGTYKLLATSPVAKSDSSASYVVAVGPAKHVRYVAGPGQPIAAIDTTTLRPTVQVQDDGGNPVAGASVTWVVDSGGGKLVDPLNPTTPASSVVTTSDASGKSAVQWWLGSAGGQTMRAYLTSGAGRDTMQFSTGVYGAGTQLVVTSVMDTAYASGTHLPLVVQVEDAGGNPVPMAGVPVAIYLDYYFCTGACDRGPAGSRPAFSRAPGRRVIAAGVRPSRPNPAPMRWPAPSISRNGRMTPNRTGTVVPAREAARARAGLGISKSVTAGGAYDYGSGVFDTLPTVPYPTLIGDTVVVTDSTGKAVFANLDIAGLSGSGYPVDVSVYDTTYSLSGTYSNEFYLTPGAPYGVYAVYDSVHQATGKLAIDVPEAAVLDSVGNYVSHAPVTFAVTAGGGSLGSTQATTDAYGDPVQVPGWTLGAASGVNSVRASATVGGPKSSVMLTATAHRPAALVLATGLSTSIVDSTILSPTPEATIADSTRTWALNDSGVVVTPSVILSPAVQTGPPAAPVLIGNTSPVAASGYGTASFIGLGVYGTRGSTVALVASSPGLASDTSAVVSITSGPAASIGGVAGEVLDSMHTVGATTRQVQVVVKDTAGYGVAGVPVTFAIQNYSTDLCLLPNGSTGYVLNTDAAGIANVTVTLPASTTSCTILAMAYDQGASLLSGAPVTFQEVVAPPSFDVWKGVADTNWTNPSNWSGGVPTQTTSVFIPYVMTSPVHGRHYPSLIAAATVNTLRVDDNVRFELHDFPIQVYGNLERVGSGANTWSSLGGGTGYVEMMTPGKTVGGSIPYKLLIGDTTMACAGAAAVTVIGIDSASVLDVNCPLAISSAPNSWFTSRGDVNVKHHGTLQITGAGTWLYAEGNLNITSDQSSVGLLTGGNIQIYKNFVQDTVPGVAASYTNFVSSGTSVRMQSSPYGVGGVPQTIQFASPQAKFWDLYAANPSSSVSLSSTAAATYTIQGVFSIGTGTGNVAFTIPVGITLNVGTLSLGSTGHLYVNGTFNSGTTCDPLTLPFITVGGSGVITPASCHP